MSNLSGTPTFKNLVAFCVLMQSGVGIDSKSPDYIREKWRLACDNMILNALDSHNQAKYYEYMETWNRHGLCEEEA